MTQDIAAAHTDALTDSTPAPETAVPGGDISAREAVRRAVAELGADAELDDVLAHLQAKYGLCPPRGTAQSYLSLAAKTPATDPRPNRAAAVVRANSPPTTKASSRPAPPSTR